MATRVEGVATAAAVAERVAALTVRRRELEARAAVVVLELEAAEREIAAAFASGEDVAEATRGRVSNLRVDRDGLGQAALVLVAEIAELEALRSAAERSEARAAAERATGAVIELSDTLAVRFDALLEEIAPELRRFEAAVRASWTAEERVGRLTGDRWTGAGADMAAEIRRRHPWFEPFTDKVRELERIRLEGRDRESAA